LHDDDAVRLAEAFRIQGKGPPLSGRLALLCGAVAVTLATVIRAAIDGVVTGCEFTPYLPFVLLSAVLLRWWQASVVALASVVILGLLFVGPPDALSGSSCFLSSAGIFLGASAAMICGVILVRRLIHSIHTAGADETAGGVVFSLQDGEVWASWYGQGPPVLLGSQTKVSTMMKDFLAQVEVGKRLNGRPESRTMTDALSP
jgi:hypothetical protein